jgi:hypothetical protein
MKLVCPLPASSALSEGTGTWTYVLGIGVAVVLLLLVIRRLRAPSAAQLMEQNMRRDARHPLRAWAQAAFLIVTGDGDYAYIGAAEARRMLRNWWDVHGPHELRAALKLLAASGRPDNAWDLVRFIVVSRMGVAASYIDNDDAWDGAYPIAVRLQRAYESWTDLGQAYIQARRQWRRFPLDGSEDDAEMRKLVENVAALRHGMWTRVDYELDLAPDREDWEDA